MATDLDKGIAIGMRVSARTVLATLDRVKAGADPLVALLALAKSLSDTAAEQEKSRDAA